MLELENKKLKNIQGGTRISILPNIKCCGKLIFWIFRTMAPYL